MNINYTDNPLISVLIPTYNVEKFVEEAVESILNQTYINLEIIIVDDCSTDNTYEILIRLSKKDDRIRLFRNIRNLQIVDTLNFALTKIRGSYVARMDGDDVYEVNRIETLLRYLIENPSIDLVGSNVIVINEVGMQLHRSKYPEFHDQIVKLSHYVSPVLHIWLAKANIYIDVGDYRIPFVEDYDFILRCIDSGKKLANQQDYSYIQRMRDGNTMTANGLIQRRRFRYVRKLHIERKRSGQIIDSYSIDTIKEISRIGFISKNLFNVSSYCHNQYIQNKQKNKVSALFFYILSILAMPRTRLENIYNRYIYKRIIRGM